MLSVDQYKPCFHLLYNEIMKEVLEGDESHFNTWYQKWSKALQASWGRRLDLVTPDSLLCWAWCFVLGVTRSKPRHCILSLYIFFFHIILVHITSSWLTIYIYKSGYVTKYAVILYCFLLSISLNKSSKCNTYYNFDQLMVLDEKSVTRVSAIHPLGNMNVYIKFQVDPSYSCWDISLKTKDVNHIVVLEEKLRINKVTKNW